MMRITTKNFIKNQYVIKSSNILKSLKNFQQKLLITCEKRCGFDPLFIINFEVKSF